MMCRILVASLFLVLLTVPTGAGEIDYPIKTFYWENDDVFLPGGVDRYYTNGLRFTMLRNPENNPEWLGELRKDFCDRGWCGGMDPAETLSVVVGHSFYTPEKIDVPTPQPFDRPFAGWLYGGMALQVTDKNQLGDRTFEDAPPIRLTRQHSFEATLGVLGPAAQAEFIQREWHALPFINGRVPRGWPNQLKNEPTLQLVYQQSWRTGWPSFDIVPTATAAVGTVHAFAGVGVTARVGRNISGFGIPIIPVSVAATRSRPDLEWYFFLGTDTRWIARNAFLDGGLRGGPSVDRENVVNDWRVGGSFRWKSLRGTYTYVHRSQEFEVLPRRDGRHRFASIAVSVERPLNF